MTSKREIILTQVKTSLAGTTSVGSRIYRSRPEPTRREDMPCLVIDWTSDSASYNTMDFMNRILTFRVTVITYGTNPDTAADPIWVSMYKKMMADRTLNNKCQDLTTLGTNTQIIEGDNPIIAMTETFSCTYRHNASDPEN